MQENDVQEKASVAGEVTESAEGSKAGLKDIVTVQAIVCVIIGIAFTSLNILKSELAADIFEVYSEKSSVCGSIMNLVNAFIDFLGSTPNV